MKLTDWIKFIRHYGPISRNDNMYDETIQRSARRLKITPLEFEHPLQAAILRCFDHSSPDPVSVILSGTAGDGKTHLCRQVWRALGGDENDWMSDNPYLTMMARYPQDRKTWPASEHEPDAFRTVKIHFIRDLSGWAPQQGMAWDEDKERLLSTFCHSIFNPESSDIFLIAANDGQLVESWRRLQDTADVVRTRRVFEEMLVEDRQSLPNVRLTFFNLSHTGSAELFDQAIPAFLNHPGWEELRQGMPSEHEAFGPNCPIRLNYELLASPLVQARLRALLELCDHNGLHVPIRQILLLLANAVLGHPEAKDFLMVPADIPGIITRGTVSKASLYNNIFGGNLPENRRQSITIFEYFDRFQIGYETSNRIDNILIFGENDENLGGYFDTLVAQDLFYGADALFYAGKREYIESGDEGETVTPDFLQMLVCQRRALFFKIPQNAEHDLKLWELTVFKYAGEYLTSVVETLRQGHPVKRPILSRLVKGLNRVFTGILMNSDRELFLATSGNYSQAKVCRILLERVSVEPSKGERVVLSYQEEGRRVLLSVYFTPTLCVHFPLTLIRYEFLSRIALEGALPASFSKECYEDLLAFKSQLIAAFMKRQAEEPTPPGSAIGINLLSLTEQGMPDPTFVEVNP